LERSNSSNTPSLEHRGQVVIGLPIPPATPSPAVLAVALVLALVCTVAARTPRHRYRAPKGSPFDR